MTGIDGVPEQGSPLDVLFAASAPMRAVCEAIKQAAASRSGVLLVGEPATGRRTIATVIHQLATPHAPFVTVDCARSLAHRVEQVLLGRPVPCSGDPSLERRAAETISATSSLCAARGGTLLLLNVVDLSGRVQGRLARALRDDEATLDDGTTVRLDVMPIARVEPSFDLACEEGRVRPELHRRLNGLRIAVPSLRERREDVPRLVDFFLSKACRSRGVPVKTITFPTLTLLSALAYRGNARELEAVVTALVEIVPGRTIRLEDVLSTVRMDGGAAPRPVGTLRQARRQFEREYIQGVLERHRGCVADAARSLGIQRTNLYRKMRSLGLANLNAANAAGRDARN